MKKRIFLTVWICLLCVCLIAALAACDKNDAPAGGEKDPSNTQTEQPGGEKQEDKGDQTGETGETTEKPDNTEKPDDTGKDLFGKENELPRLPI